MAFVLDPSVTMAWCFRDETNAYTESVLERLESEEAIVPGIWVFDVINVLLIAERKGRLTPALADEFMLTLSTLPIAVQPVDWPAGTESLLLRGRTTGLTAYDTAYLDLALRSGCPLATQAQKLQEVARDLGVELLMFPMNS